MIRLNKPVDYHLPLLLLQALQNGLQCRCRIGRLGNTQSADPAAALQAILQSLEEK
jgi:hypothetical protein